MVIYPTLIVFLIPFLLLRLLWKSIKIPAYRQRMGERLAGKAPLQKSVDIWLHAVSLGEVIAASPLIEALLQKNYRLMVTTTTPTGSAKLLSQFADRLEHQYLPFDLPLLQKRFLQQIRPKLVLVMETELWPAMSRAIAGQNIPLLLINARLSAQSMQGYQRIPKTIAGVLACFDKILAQSAEDAERFAQLGATQEQREVLGNIKFDLHAPSQKNLDIAKNILAQTGSQRFVIILASTHANEEEQILQHWSMLKQNIPGLLLLVVPRHPERFRQVERMIMEKGLRMARRSEKETVQQDTEVLLIDSMGELTAFYSQSQLAFIGGSLVPVGGHNMLEAIAMQIPVLCGPHLHNFQSIARDLERAQAMLVVKDASLLSQAMVDLALNPQRRQELAARANGILLDNKGALDRHLHWIAQSLPGA